MKNALILHGKDAGPDANWFKWLKTELESRGYVVTLPQLPDFSRPKISTTNSFLLDKYSFNEETVIIGHSAGSVAAIGLLAALSGGIRIKLAVLTGVLENDLGWEELSQLFEEPIEYEEAKKHCHKFIVVHSDNDQHIPMEQAEHVCEKLGGELKVMHGTGHFNVDFDSRFKEFPELLPLIEEHL